MAESFMPPVVAELGANVAGFLEGFTSAFDMLRRFQLQSQETGAVVAESLGLISRSAVEMQTVIGGMSETATASMGAVAASTEEMAAASRVALVTVAQGAEEATVSLSATAARATEVGAATEAASVQVSGFGAALGTAAKWGALALGAIGVASVEMATEFDASTTRLVTSAGETEDNLNMVRDGLLKMAGQVGVRADELSKALYFVDAAGYRAADGLTVLKAAAQGAAAEGADTTTVAKALTDVLVDYHLKASDAANVTSQMITAVAHGKTTLQEFSSAFASIVPAASAAGISYQDVTAALAQMTNHGFTATRASQNLAQALRSLLNPTGTMRKAFDEYGVSSEVLRSKLNGPNGLTDAMEYVSQAATKAGKEGTPEFAAALKRLMGTAPGANAALATVGANFSATAETIKAVGDSTADASGKVMGFALVEQTLGQQLREIGAGLEAVMIRTGEFLIPYVSKSISEAESLGSHAVHAMADLWDIYGPAVEQRLSAGESGVAAGTKALLGPLKAGLTDLAVNGVPVAIKVFDKLDDKFTEVAHDAKPVVDGLHAMYESATSSGGAIDTLVQRVKAGTTVVGGLTVGLGSATALLRPLGELVGGLAQAFSELPGPVQLSVLSMVALRPFRPQIQELRDTVVGYGRSAVSSFQSIGQAMDMQRAVASHYGIELSRTGAAFAAIEARLPVVAAMGETFRNASGGVTGFTRALGVGASAGLMGAMRGLWTFMGGPWGVAILAVTQGLDMLAKHQQEAAAAAEAHRQRVSSLTSALKDSNGVINASVRATVVQTLADTKLKDGKTALLDITRKAGISTSDLTDAYLGQGGSITDLVNRLNSLAEANRVHIAGQLGSDKAMTEAGQRFSDAAGIVKSFTSELPAAVNNQKDLQAAIDGGAAASAAASTPVAQLKNLLKTLGDTAASADDKANALHQTLRLLSGGALDVQAAVASQNTAITELGHAWKDNLDTAKGYANALLNVDGSLSTVTENGQSLFEKLTGLRDQTADAAKATYDYAKASGVGLPDALKQAEGAMQKSWEAAMTAGEQMGLTADQASQLAAQMGLIPSNLAITLGVKDFDSVKQALLYVQGLANHLKEGATVKVGALTAEALAKLHEVGVKTQSLPDGTVQISVPTADVMRKLDDIINTRIPDKHFNITASFQSRFLDAGQIQGNADGGVISHFAAGGTVPGYAPRRDTVLSWLSPGEGVLVPEAVRALGGAATIAAINHRARSAPSSLGPAPAPSSSPGGPSGGQPVEVHNHFHIAGSVLSERDLRDVVQKQMLQLGAANSQTWQAYARR